MLRRLTASTTRVRPHLRGQQPNSTLCGDCLLETFKFQQLLESQRGWEWWWSEDFKTERGKTDTWDTEAEYAQEESRMQPWKQILWTDRHADPAPGIPLCQVLCGVSHKSIPSRWQTWLSMVVSPQAVHSLISTLPHHLDMINTLTSSLHLQGLHKAIALIQASHCCLLGLKKASLSCDLCFIPHSSRLLQPWGVLTPGLC